MYVLPLPPRPNLDQYKKRAKELVKVCKTGDRQALRDWTKQWMSELFKLQEDASTARKGYRPYAPGELESRIESTAEHLADQLQKAEKSGRSCTLAKAQFVIAREHGFASWPKFASHLEGLWRARSDVSAFEAAVEAIVEGDIAKLRKLLKAHPDLVHVRSMREHHSTLLHYVSANGVEDFRQKTPKNIVQITKLLLKAGADVNAESGAYGGHSNTLGLTATSVHPQNAGVQLELLDVLLDAGSKIDVPGGGSCVNACLRNGRGMAATYLASRGAKLDLEGAIGSGRLDVVQSFFDADGTLKPPATKEQLRDGFAWACEFGHIDEVRFLLQTGECRSAALNQEGRETGLHWAAHEAHAEIVRLLLDHGAPVNVRDKRHNGMPIHWAMHAWGAANDHPRRERFYAVIEMLIKAGAKIDSHWFEARPAVAKKLQSDPRMQAALNRQSLQ